MIKKRLLYTILIFVLLLTADNAWAGFSHFVRADGDRLMDGDREYRFISFNIPNLHMIEDQMPFNEMNPWRLPDTYELNDALMTVAQMGGQAVRIYAITVRRPDDPPGTPKHVLGPGEFNEEAFRALDNMMAIAAKHGIRVIIPLMDNWPWMGGREEYAGFTGKEKDEFWTDPVLRADFKKTIDFIINRTNTVTGVKYRDDKAILAWETGHELTSTPEWVADIAAYIRGIDSNHLIADGYHSNMIRESSLSDPSISLVTTHHYEQDPGLMAKNIRSNMDMARGKKPYFVGEFGFISRAGLETAIRAIIESGASGGLSWSLRFHSRDGGFYWHSEMQGLGIYKAFHWPGFDSGRDYDERNVMRMMRKKAFEIRNQSVPRILPPGAPKLLAISSPASINWQGSTGASEYDIQRRELPKGKWITLETGLSDANEAYRPLYADKETIADRTYEYRVRAGNSAGKSKWSKPMGPVNGIGKVISDPMKHTADIFMSGGRLEFTTKNSRQAKEDIYRLSGEKDAFIIYHLDDPFDQFQIDSFFPGEVIAPRIEISPDGISYSKLLVTSESYFVEDKAYGYFKPVRYSFKKQGLKAKYQKITWGTLMHIAHTDVGP
ncbi:MAG: cellulase family glycosylhydrolase [Deltaproteobacteria bacterium]|nr:cellulase family glycosylhydrolase [Deltaproteobacteria bacterium]